MNEAHHFREVLEVEDSAEVERTQDSGQARYSSANFKNLAVPSCALALLETSLGLAALVPTDARYRRVAQRVKSS